MKLENVTMDMLGTAKRVNITKDETTIVDGPVKNQRLKLEYPRLKLKSKKRLLITTKKNFKNV